MKFYKDDNNNLMNYLPKNCANQHLNHICCQCVDGRGIHKNEKTRMVLLQQILNAINITIYNKKLIN